MAVEDNSFITLHRKLLLWEWYTDINTKCLFIHLLLTASHKDYNWRGIEIKRGQVMTGRKVLSTETGLSEQEVRTALDKLKSTNEITIKATKKYSIVTVRNYGAYQDKKERKQPSRQPSGQPTEQPTSNQQATTYNNVNNVSTNVDTGASICDCKVIPPDKWSVARYFEDQGSGRDAAREFFNHFESNGWMVGGKSKMRNWQAAANNWMSRDKKTSHAHGSSTPAIGDFKFRPLQTSGGVQ